MIFYSIATCCLFHSSHILLSPGLFRKWEVIESQKYERKYIEDRTIVKHNVKIIKKTQNCINAHTPLK